jgi:2,3-bisphosphoglycerate-dependent phosphoglycerate mutase
VTHPRRTVVTVTDHPPTRLVLVRHGESVATVDRFIGGFRTCTGLSDLGRQQTERLRDRLARTGEIAADRLYASNFARARETAEIIAPALGGLDVVDEPGFGEHDPGPDCDGMTFSDFVDRFGSGHDWQNPFAESFPGGETIASFHHRVGAAAYGIVTRHAGETIVVSCHGGVVDALLRLFLRVPSTGGFEIRTTNTSLTEFLLAPSGLWQMIRYNDSAHLAGLPIETEREAA